MVKDMAGLGWVELDKKDSQRSSVSTESADQRTSVTPPNEGVEEFHLRIRAYRDGVVMISKSLSITPTAPVGAENGRKLTKKQREVPMTWVKLLRCSKVLATAGALSFAVTLTASTDRGGALRRAG